VHRILQHPIALAALWFAVPASAADWSSIQGVNYFSSNASNAHEMWLHFDAGIVDRELGWAQSLGFNSVRLSLSVPAYRQDSTRFLTNLGQCLDLCRKHNLTAMLVLFDSCGIEPRPDAVEMTIHQAYQRFLGDGRLPGATRKLIREHYGEFAEGRGKDMLIRVGADTPFDVLFWQHWAPNPGLRNLGRDRWADLNGYAQAVLRLGGSRPEVIAYDLMNEPGCLFDLPAGRTAEDARRQIQDFLENLVSHLKTRFPKAELTIGSANYEEMRRFSKFQTVLSVHSYKLGTELRQALTEAKEFAAGQKKPILLTECLANTDNWLKVHGEERLSTDEAQLRHYRETLPVILESGMGWYSWGFVAGSMFT